MSGSKTQKTRSYHTYLMESLQDPIEAAAYLEVALEEKDPALLLLAIQNIAEAQIKYCRSTNRDFQTK